MNDNNQEPRDNPADIQLGIWGTTGAGKTTYLAMLYDALERDNNWRVGVVKKAREFAGTHRKTIRIDRIFPAPTPVPDQLETLDYTLINQGSGKRTVIKFIDAPGRFYEQIKKTPTIVKQENKSTDSKQEFEDIVDYLRACNGIILLLDPDRMTEKRDDFLSMLTELFQEFYERENQENENRDNIFDKLKHYIAFCVTKVDRQKIWSKGQESKKLVEEVMGEDTLMRILNNYVEENRCEYFSVSSIGCYKDKQGNWHSAVDEPGSSTTSQENSGSSTSCQENSSSTIPQEDNDIGRFLNIKSPIEDISSSQAVPNDIEHSTSLPEDPDPYAPAPARSTQTNIEDLNQRQVRIKPGVEIKPHNVIAPIMWLIENI